MKAEQAGVPPGIPLLLGDGRPPPDTALIAPASGQRLELLLYSRLLQEDRLATRVRAMAIEALEQAGVRNRQLLAELHRLTALLAEVGIPALPLKGPVLAQFLWDDPSLRRCRDIDILLPAEDVPKALLVLEADHYSLVSPAGTGLLRQVELWNESNGLSLDLHWNITHGELPFQLDFGRLWQERREVVCDGMPFAIASPEWLFLFSSLYLVKSHPWPELLYLSDLARLVQRSPQMDWVHLAEIARLSGTQRICRVALALVDALAGSGVPAQARAFFPADSTVLTLARRVAGAAGRPPPLEDPGDVGAAALRRLRRLAAHAGFREQPRDKARIALGLLMLGLGSGSDLAGQAQRPLRLERLARLGSAAARAAKALRQIVPPSASAPCPAGDTRFYPLDDAGVVLSLRQKALFALSPSAAFVWRGLQDGTGRRRMVRMLADLSGQSVAEAGAQVADTLHQWRMNGLLADSSTPHAAERERLPAAGTPAEAEYARPRWAASPGGSPRPRRYRQLDTVFEIALPTHSLDAAFHTALGHLATVEAPQVTVSVATHPTGHAIVVNGREEDRCETTDAIVPALKAILATAAINRTDFGLYIHGAMLRNGRDAVLLPAPPHSGKTCLAATLARRGLTFCTDETTLLDRHCFAARGLPAALAVKAGAWELLQPLYPELRALPAHRRADGKVVKYLPPPVGGDAAELDRPCRVRAIVFPHYAAGTDNTLVPLMRVEALRLLMEECVAMRLDLCEEQVQGLIDWLAGISCYALAYSDLSAAADLILPCLPPDVNSPELPAQPRHVA